jgi:hypothetical protein
MLNAKLSSGILIALLAVNLSLLTFASTVKPARAAPDPWEMPVVYLQAIPLTPTKLQVNLAIYNLTNTFYPSDYWWIEGAPLPPSITGPPVARYYYPLGNLYAFDIAIRWNPAVLSYVSHIATVPRTTSYEPFRSKGVLNSPFILAACLVDPVAGTFRTAYCSHYPAASCNAPLDAANVCSLTFTVLDAGDYGLGLESVDLVLDPLYWVRGGWGVVGVQPEIVWRRVLDPVLAHNVGVEAAPRNKDVVGETKPYDVYALVKNAGATPETFNVTIYVGATQVGTALAVVAAGTQQTVKIPCSTTGFAKGTYAIKAVAASVAGETYPADNEITQGTIMVTLVGDVNGDKCVNIFDIVTMAGGYGANNQAATNYNPYADLDNNYRIDIFDIVTAASNYGKCWT